MIDLRQFQYFAAVAEELHFGRAAERLCITQPALSQMIRRLEQELGVDLFRRVARRVELTDAGQLLLTEARLVLAQAEAAVQSITRIQRGELGRLSVGYTGETLYGVLPPIIRAFRDRFPAVELTLHELSTRRQCDALGAGQVQVGFLHPPVRTPTIATKAVFRDQIAVVLPREHPLAQLPRLPLAALADEPLILYPREVAPDPHDEIVARCLQAGFRPRIVCETTTQESRVGMVAAGLGITMVSATLRRLPRPEVVYRPLAEPKVERVTAIAWRRESASPVVTALLKLVDEVIPAIQQSLCYDEGNADENQPPAGGRDR